MATLVVNATILSPSNATILSPSNATVTPPDPASSTNSRASVFSTIIALVLCCLTQPNGSLLFPGRSNWFWRLSPLSAIIEVAIVLYCVLFLRTRSPHLGSVEDSDSLHLGSEIHGESAWTSRAQLRRRLRRRALQWKHTLRVKLDHMGVLHGWRICAATLVLLRGGSASVGDISAETVRQNQLIRDRRRVHIWTAVTMAFLVAKLCVVKGAPLFTFFGFCYALSWISVEAICLVAGWRKLKDEDIESIVDASPRLRKMTRGGLWSLVWVVANVALGEAAVYFLIRGFFRLPNWTDWMYLPGALFFILLITLSSLFDWQDGDQKIETVLGQVILISYVGIMARVEHKGLLYSMNGHVVYDSISLLSSAVYGVIGMTFGIMLLPFMVGFAALFPWFLDAELRSLVGLFNCVVFAGGLGWYLYFYDPVGTVKPGWLEWIGM